MVELLPNETIFFQIGIFLFTYIILNFLVFRPILRLLDRRKALTVGAEHDAQALNEKTQALMETHQQKIQEARLKGLALRDKAKKEGEGEAGALAAKAHQELEAALEKARAEISQQSKEAQLKLRSLSRDLSREMAEKLLGRKVAS
ncbi:MAG: ATP synthase F0 subunit B [Deltaproteobacteria bacterium]|nr:ATP synthase F0 subunit B [Deltaproteobacteria bacterium]